MSKASMIGRARWPRLWPDERGVAALEFAFVVPFLVIIFSGIVQFGAIFFIQNNMTNVAREVSRALSVGTIETSAEAETLANGKLVNWGIGFNVSATIPDPNDPNDTDYTVVIIPIPTTPTTPTTPWSSPRHYPTPRSSTSLACFKVEP
jgi:hypothetical protein